MIELAASHANFWCALAFLLMGLVTNVFTLVMCHRWNAHFVNLLNELAALHNAGRATLETRNAPKSDARRGQPRSFAARV